MEAIKNILKKYWWVILIIILLIVWYYYSQDTTQQQQDVKKKKFIGGGMSECQEVTWDEWNRQRSYILAWLDWQPQSVRDEISCIYWEKSGDVWLDVSYRFAEDELLRKGYCKPK